MQDEPEMKFQKDPDLFLKSSGSFSKIIEIFFQNHQDLFGDNISLFALFLDTCTN